MSMKDDVKLCARPKCGHPERAHDEQGCLSKEKCSCDGFVPEESKEAQPDSVKESEMELPPLEGYKLKRAGRIRANDLEEECTDTADLSWMVAVREEQLLAQIAKTNAAEAELTSLRGAGWVSVKGFANNACRDLPDGWQLTLEMESGSGAFRLFRPDGTEVDEEEYGSVDYSI